jgi:hypothetical protein
VQLLRFDKPDAASNEEATAQLRVTVKDKDPKKVGRAFANAVIEMACANYPGFFCTSPPSGESPYGVYWPALVPVGTIEEVVVTDSGERRPVAQTASLLAERGVAPPEATPPARALPSPPSGALRRAPLGALFGARSGDKGGNANVGLWARSDLAFAWLRQALTVERFRELVPEARGLEVRRYELASIRALNFVVVGLLGDGVAASTRFDPQAKGLGEYLRSRLVEIPVVLLESEGA